MRRIGYEATHRVSYFQIDGRQRMTPAALLADLQEAAVTHSDTLGFTLDYMAEHQWGWAVINWHLRIGQMPKHGEKITIQTWSDKCRKVQATRSFLVLDEKGALLLDGASRWIFMDLEKRKPANIPEKMMESYHSGQEPAIEGEKFLMSKTGENGMQTERSFTITRRDTDTNGHANNVKYLEWAMDDVPDEIYENKDLADIRITYRKECMRGDEITTKTTINFTEEGDSVLTVIGGDSVFAEVVSLWK